MNRRVAITFRAVLLLGGGLALVACAAGDMRFSSDTPAGFWAGLWHGIISFITLIIHIFNPAVMVYEVNNSGGWYDFGFLVGVATFWGGGRKVVYKSPKRRQRDEEWREINAKVEQKVMRKMKEWAEDESGQGLDEDWADISDKVQKKLKKKLREWAEKE